jgi:hypothetical protein
MTPSRENGSDLLQLESKHSWVYDLDGKRSSSTFFPPSGIAPEFLPSDEQSHTESLLTIVTPFILRIERRGVDVFLGIIPGVDIDRASNPWSMCN